MVLSLATTSGASSSSSSSSNEGQGQGQGHVQSAVDASIVAMTNHALTRLLRDDPTTGNSSYPNLIIT